MRAGGFCVLRRRRLGDEPARGASVAALAAAVAGAGIALLYRLTKLDGLGTDAIIDAIHEGRAISVLLVPVIFVSTAATHLFGGSAGREGAALQIGGSLGQNIARVFRLDDKDRRLATLCGMSALFSRSSARRLRRRYSALEVISVGEIYYCRAGARAWPARSCPSA